MFRDYTELIETVTLWAVADDAIWIDNNPVKNRKDWPILFDIARNPKAFYCDIILLQNMLLYRY